jgi:transposase-like protein
MLSLILAARGIVVSYESIREWGLRSTSMEMSSTSWFRVGAAPRRQSGFSTNC